MHRDIHFRRVASSLLLALLCCTNACELKGADPQLTLPTEFYAVAGSEMSVYFANTILAERPAEFRFDVTCDVGAAEATRWQATPDERDVGRHPFALNVVDGEGNELASGTSTLVVAPADAGQGRSLRLLIIGDSLTHASQYPNEIARLLERPGNPTFAMLGTHKPASAKPNVAHEGYGGWTWRRFLDHYEPNPDGTHRKKSSPLVYLNEAESPELNIGRYIAEHCEGVAPDVVIFKLGINDCYRANAESTATIDETVDAVFQHADQLLAAFRQAAPNAEFGICLTTPGNARDAAFRPTEKDTHPRWTWRRIQHRLVERQLEHFAGREQDGIFVIPTQLNLDTLAGYPDNNAVHPNSVGYVQIGNSIYAWLKHRLAESH